jgi:predicted phage replisome organizer
MADIKWIKITTDIFNDEKMLMIESMPDADSVIVIWFKLLCLAGRDNNNGIMVMNNRLPYTEEMLASIFRRPINTVRLALSEFSKYGMIEIVEDVITIPNWDKHQNIDGMEKIREQTRERVAKYREKQKLLVCNATCNATVTQGNAIDKEEEKEKRKKNKNKDNKEIFDTLRSDYILHTAVEEKVLEWLNYKNERKEFYVEQGMKTLLRQIENNSLTYGDEALCQVIDDSMSNGYKGIIFDKLTKGKPQQNQNSYQEQVNNRMSVVDNW